MKILQLKRDKDVLLVCKMRRGSGTQGQQPLWSKAAFIARVWIGLDRQAISLAIVHSAFENTLQRITVFKNQLGSKKTNTKTPPLTKRQKNSLWKHALRMSEEQKGTLKGMSPRRRTLDD